MRKARDMTAISSMADELQRAFENGITHPTEDVDSNSLTLACEHLLETGRIAAAEQEIRRLHAALPSLPYAESMTRVFDAAREDSAPLLDFTDDPALDVNVARRPNCDRVLLVFCGLRNRPGLPTALIHEWLGRLPVSVVYLRDFRKSVGVLGYPSLGPDRRSSVEGLKRLVNDLGGRRIYTFGNSSGTFSALHYGLDLEARAVLCMSGPTTLTREFNADITTSSKSLARAPAEFCRLWSSTCGHFMQSWEATKILYVYGTELR